jgi:hypothetical protein
VSSYIVYVWRENVSVGVISTEDKQLLAEMTAWLEASGYRVRVKHVESKELNREP